MYSQHDVVELVSMLVGAPTIEEQADILHYLVLCYGPRYKILAAQVRVIHILHYQLFFLTFPADFSIPIIFSNLNYNCSNFLDQRNLQEQVKIAFCYQKLF